MIYWLLSSWQEPFLYEMNGASAHDDETYSPVALLDTFL